MESGPSSRQALRAGQRLSGLLQAVLYQTGRPETRMLLHDAAAASHGVVPRTGYDPGLRCGLAARQFYNLMSPFEKRRPPPGRRIMLPIP